VKQTDAGTTLDTLTALEEEHRRLDARVQALDQQPHLTSAERIEYCLLKKRKLLTKDRINRLRISA